MIELKTKFNLGEFVYWARTSWSQTFDDCVQCAGKGEVTVVTQQESYVAKCPYCSDLGINSVSGKVRRYDYLPLVTFLTIGQITVSYRQDKDNREVVCVEERYMANETGIGTGTLYDAHDLFADREAARAHAKARCAEARLAHQQHEADRLAQASKKSLPKKREQKTRT